MEILTILVVAYIAAIWALFATAPDEAELGLTRTDRERLPMRRSARAPAVHGAAKSAMPRRSTTQNEP